MGYSPERKSAVLMRMLPPNNVAIRQLAHEEGISEATLHKWRAEARGKGRLLPDANAGPDGWSSRDKFAAVLETAALNDATYCDGPVFIPFTTRSITRSHAASSRKKRSQHSKNKLYLTPK